MIIIIIILTIVVCIYIYIFLYTMIECFDILSSIFILHYNTIVLTMSMVWLTLKCSASSVAPGSNGGPCGLRESPVTRCLDVATELMWWTQAICKASQS